MGKSGGPTRLAVTFTRGRRLSNQLTMASWLKLPHHYQKLSVPHLRLQNQNLHQSQSRSPRLLSKRNQSKSPPQQNLLSKWLKKQPKSIIQTHLWKILAQIFLNVNLTHVYFRLIRVCINRIIWLKKNIDRELKLVAISHN